MRHIKTLSKAESAMRALYKEASDHVPAVAEEAHAKLIDEIIEKTRQVDLLKLDISEAVGKLMGFIQGHSALADESGRIMCTWDNSSDKRSVDYEAILTELDVPAEIVEKHTTVSKGPRIFKVID